MVWYRKGVQCIGNGFARSISGGSLQLLWTSFHDQNSAHACGSGLSRNYVLSVNRGIWSTVARFYVIFALVLFTILSLTDEAV